MTLCYRSVVVAFIGSVRDFVACYHAENRHKRNETDRFHAFDYEDLIKRDKASLDIFRPKDDSLEDAANLPAPDVISAEIVEDLQSALDEFALAAEDLRKNRSIGPIG